MNNVHLIINGQKFPLHYQLLSEIASLPDAEHYRELARAFLTLGVPSITQRVIECSLRFLDRQDLDGLWAAGDPDIRRSLLGLSKFVENLTDTQARDILDADDLDMFAALEDHEDLEGMLLKAQERGARLSGAMADALRERIARRRSLEAHQAFEGYLKFLPLRHHVEHGYGSDDVFSRLPPEDIGLLNTASLETLRHVALNVHDIADGETRKKVARLLSAHSDPYVRLALAKNDECPRSILTHLLEDPEPDVSLAARRSLDSHTDDEEGDCHE